MDDYKTTMKLITQSLDNLSTGLAKLSKFTNGSVNGLRLKVKDLEKEIEALQTQPCPKDPEAILEVIEIAQLKQEASAAKKKPKKDRKIIFWVLSIIGSLIAIVGGLIAFALTLQKWIKLIN